MLPRTPRPIALGASVALTAAGLLLAGTTSASAADQPALVGLSASAYGSTVSVSPVSSGKSAFFSACSTADGNTYGNNVAAADFGALGKVGAVVTAGTRTGNAVVVTSTTGEINLLGGLVRATEIKSTSQSALSGSAFSSSGSTVITGFKIAGLPRTVPAAPGSTIDLPGVARLTFNKQTPTTTPRSSSLTVEALRVDLLKGNKLGLATGTIVIGSSTSGANAPTYFNADGQAYGTGINIANVVNSGPNAYVGMPCGGTGGAVIKNKIVGITLPGLVKTQTVASTGQSIEGDGTTTSAFSNTVSGVDLLNGTITADAVVSKTSTTRSASGLVNSADGTLITNLTVLGTPVNVTKNNAKIDVAGVGTLTVRKTVKQATGQDVIGLELKVTTDQVGLKAGSLIQVAVAKSRVAVS